MADREVKTVVTLEAKAKGFEQTQKRAEQLRDALNATRVAGGFQKLDALLRGLDQRLGKAAKGFDVMNSSAERFERTLNRILGSMQRALPAGQMPAGLLGAGSMRGEMGGTMAMVPYGPTAMTSTRVPSGGAAIVPWSPVGRAMTRYRAPFTGQYRPSYVGGDWSGAQILDMGGGGGNVPPPPGRGYGGRFLRGFLQGAGFGEYWPGEDVRGMLWQGAGRLTGGGFRRGARGAWGIATTPFTGLEGLSTSLSAIPGVGPLTAGQLQIAMANAQEALQVQRQEVDLAPLMRHRRGLAAKASDLAQIRFEAGEYHDLTRAELQAARTWATAKERPEAQGLEYVPDNFPGIDDMRREELERRREVKKTLPQAMAQARQEAHYAQKATQAERLAAARSGAYREALYGGALGFGERMGFAMPQAYGILQQLAQRGGISTISEPAVQTAMAAQRAFHVQTETSASFLRGARLGGVVGGGTGEEALTKAIGVAFRLALDEAEIPELTEQMAHSLQSFENSGMPLNVDAVAKLSQGFIFGGGMKGMRGVQAAQTLIGAGERISTTGPQNAAEFQMLQTLGGFQGGGLNEVWGAMKALGTKNFEGPGMRELVRRSVAAGGGTGAGGYMTLMRTLQQLGLSVGHEDVERIARWGMGEEPGGIDKLLKEAEGRGPKTPEDVISRAAEIMDKQFGALQKQARLDNDRVDSGRAFVGAMQDLNESMLIIQKAFKNYAPEISAGIVNIKDWSKSLGEAIRNFHNLLFTGNAGATTQAGAASD